MTTNNRTPKVFLLDGSALAYRAYFAFIKNPLINSRGENTSAPYGFTRLLLRIRDEEQPDYLAVVFDTPKPTFRHEMYAEYKASRERMPDEMAEQLPRIREIIAGYNIPILEIPGYEADDVLGTLAKQFEKVGIHTYLVTGDKDFMQLVSPKISVYNLKRVGDAPEIINPKKVVEKMGVPPEKIIDLLGLMGDASDNVPGAAGVGPKNAVDLLNEFGSLDGVLENCEQISKKRIRESLIENRELVLLSRQLVTIDTRVPVEIKLEDLKFQEEDSEKLLSLFKELEFHSLIDRYTTQSFQMKVDYRTLDSLDLVDAFIKDLFRIGEFTFDLETTHIDPLQAEIVGLSFCYQPGLAFYIPVRAFTANGQTEGLFSNPDNISLDIGAVLKKLKPLLENPEIKKCGQNIKYDMLVLSNYGIVVKGITFDTMLASYVLNPEQRQHNLDSLALAYFNYKKIPTSELIGKGKKQISMAEVPVEKVAFYACEDADMTQRLKEMFQRMLREDDLEKLFQQVEMPLIEVLFEMERNGITINVDYLQNLTQELDLEMEGILKRIEKYAGSSVNLNSPKQLQELLFDKLQLKPLKKTKTGFSTDVTVLEELAKQHELPAAILEYRQLSKLQSTYVTALPKMINPRTGRIHTSFNQTVTVTGRLSSSDPNLQNIPIRTETGRKIRQAFIPRSPDSILIDADYSQIELRIMAHLSGDRTLSESFRNNEDIHQRTAALIFDIVPEAVTADQRRQAKAINFGIIYGMGAYGLASRLDISQSEAEDFIEEYFQKYPGVKAYIDQTIADARKKGYVTTLLGRRRKLPDILSDNRRRREFAERTAINTPIQGTAADLIKVAMIHIQQRIVREKRPNIKMLLQVHDNNSFAKKWKARFNWTCRLRLI